MDRIALDSTTAGTHNFDDTLVIDFNELTQGSKLPCRITIDHKTVNLSKPGESVIEYEDEKMEIEQCTENPSDRNNRTEVSSTFENNDFHPISVKESISGSENHSRHEEGVDDIDFDDDDFPKDDIDDQLEAELLQEPDDELRNSNERADGDGTACSEEFLELGAVSSVMIVGETGSKDSATEIHCVAREIMQNTAPDEQILLGFEEPVVSTCDSGQEIVLDVVREVVRKVSEDEKSDTSSETCQYNVNNTVVDLERKCSEEPYVLENSVNATQEIVFSDRLKIEGTDVSSEIDCNAAKGPDIAQSTCACECSEEEKSPSASQELNHLALRREKLAVTCADVVSLKSDSSFGLGSVHEVDGLGSGADAYLRHLLETNPDEADIIGPPVKAVVLEKDESKVPNKGSFSDELLPTLTMEDELNISDCMSVENGLFIENSDQFLSDCEPEEADEPESLLRFCAEIVNEIVSKSVALAASGGTVDGQLKPSPDERGFLVDQSSEMLSELSEVDCARPINYVSMREAENVLAEVLNSAKGGILTSGKLEGQIESQISKATCTEQDPIEGNNEVNFTVVEVVEPLVMELIEKAVNSVEGLIDNNCEIMGDDDDSPRKKAAINEEIKSTTDKIVKPLVLEPLEKSINIFEGVDSVDCFESHNVLREISSDNNVKAVCDSKILTTSEFIQTLVREMVEKAMQSKGEDQAKKHDSDALMAEINWITDETTTAEISMTPDIMQTLVWEMAEKAMQREGEDQEAKKQELDTLMAEVNWVTDEMTTAEIVQPLAYDIIEKAMGLVKGLEAEESSTAKISSSSILHQGGNRIRIPPEKEFPSANSDSADTEGKIAEEMGFVCALREDVEHFDAETVTEKDAGLDKCLKEQTFNLSAEEEQNILEDELLNGGDDAGNDDNDFWSDEENLLDEPSEGLLQNDVQKIRSETHENRRLDGDLPEYLLSSRKDDEFYEEGRDSQETLNVATSVLNEILDYALGAPTERTKSEEQPSSRVIAGTILNEIIDKATGKTDLKRRRQGIGDEEREVKKSSRPNATGAQESTEIVRSILEEIIDGVVDRRTKKRGLEDAEDNRRKIQRTEREFGEDSLDDFECLTEGDSSDGAGAEFPVAYEGISLQNEEVSSKEFIEGLIDEIIENVVRNSDKDVIIQDILEDLFNVATKFDSEAIGFIVDATTIDSKEFLKLPEVFGYEGTEFDASRVKTEPLEAYIQIKEEPDDDYPLISRVGVEDVKPLVPLPDILPICRPRRKVGRPKRKASPVPDDTSPKPKRGRKPSKSAERHVQKQTKKVKPLKPKVTEPKQQKAPILKPARTVYPAILRRSRDTMLTPSSSERKVVASIPVGPAKRGPKPKVPAPVSPTRKKRAVSPPASSFVSRYLNEGLSPSKPESVSTKSATATVRRSNLLKSAPSISTRSSPIYPVFSTSKLSTPSTSKSSAPSTSKSSAPSTSKSSAPSTSKSSTANTSRLSNPSTSRSSTPSTSKSSAASTSRLSSSTSKSSAPSASRLSAPGTSRLSAPGTSRLSAPGTSRLGAPGTSKSVAPKLVPTARKRTAPSSFNTKASSSNGPDKVLQTARKRTAPVSGPKRSRPSISPEYRLPTRFTPSPSPSPRPSTRLTRSPSPPSRPSTRLTRSPSPLSRPSTRFSPSLNSEPEKKTMRPGFLPARKVSRKNVAVKSTTPRPIMQLARKRTMPYVNLSPDLPYTHDHSYHYNLQQSSKKRPLSDPEPEPPAKRPAQEETPTTKTCFVNLQRNPVIERLLPSRKKHENEPNVCELCEPVRVFTSKQGLVNHLQEEHTTTSLSEPPTATNDRCAGCDRKYFSAKRLLEHMRTCPAVAALPSSSKVPVADLIQQRMEEKKAEKLAKEVWFNCSFCDMRFSSTSALDMHVSVNHHSEEDPLGGGGSEDSEVNEIMDQPPHFSSEIMKRSGKIVMRLSRETASFRCTHCAAIFLKQKDYEDHQVLHDMGYRCRTCPAVFDQKALLIGHELSHTVKVKQERLSPEIEIIEERLAAPIQHSMPLLVMSPTMQTVAVVKKNTEGGLAVAQTSAGGGQGPVAKKSTGGRPTLGVAKKSTGTRPAEFVRSSFPPIISAPRPMRKKP